MKKTFLAAFLTLSVIFTYAQVVSYQEIQTGISAQELVGKKGGRVIDKYVASDGITYEAGSKITFGLPANNGKYYNYFEDITSDVLGTLVEDGNKSSAQYAADHAVYKRIENRFGGTATIRKIKCLPADGFNRKTTGCIIYLVLNRGGIGCTNFEAAMASGEISTKGYTSDSALQELKKWKEKLDLELITQEENDKKKAELMKYIK